MQIIVIAGGDGSRMQPLITHKTLFPFLGVPCIAYTLESLHILHPKKLVIVAHPSVVEEMSALAKTYHAEIVTQHEPLGMADAILTAGKVLDPAESTVVIDAVTLQDPSVMTTFATAIKKMPKSILLAGRKTDVYKHGGYFVFAGDKITQIIEKPGADKMPSPYYKLVLDYFPSMQVLMSALQKAKSDQDDLYEVALSQLIKDQGATMVEVNGAHASLKHAPRVLDVMTVLLDRLSKRVIDKTAVIAKTAVIEGPVVIGSGVKIYDNAVIKGPAYIGQGTVIGNGSLVRGSCIEAGCEIGFNSEIARSYIGPGTKCHTSYVGDSIIEGESNLAAGTITANLRFDDETIFVNLPVGKTETGRRKFGSIIARGAKTGIHASLMPGTVIGAGALIGSATVVRGFVPAGSVVPSTFTPYAAK